VKEVLAQESLNTNMVGCTYIKLLSITKIRRRHKPHMDTWCNDISITK